MVSPRPARADGAKAPRRIHRGHSTSVLLTIGAVLVVHGTNVSTRLLSDDYFWLNISNHSGWFGNLVTPGGGIYRPVLGLWFTGMRTVFGESPLPYHLVALAFMALAALAVRWLALELGLGNVPATIAGVVYGTHAALTLTTFWVSAASSPLAAALAASSVALLCRPTARRCLAATLLLVLAIASRDAAVVTPAIATILLASRCPGWKGLAASLRTTAGLWAVSGGYFVLQALNGAFSGPKTAPYATNYFGRHVIDNALLLMNHAARFGIPPRGGFEVAALQVWVVTFWLLLLGFSVWAARRGSLLPLAGIACFCVSLVPYVGFTNHSMQRYYLEIALIGLALTIGSLAACARPRAVAVLVVSFVLVQIGAVQLFHERTVWNTVIERTDSLEDLSMRTPTTNGELVIETPCGKDKEWSRNGDLFRVLRDDPGLRVRFKIVKPTVSSTPANC